MGLAASVLSVGLGVVWHTPVVFAVIAVLLVALTVTMPGGGVIDAARRMIAFRADHTGITLGAVPGKLSGRGPAVFIPRADIERSTVARLLADRLTPSVHLHSDDFRPVTRQGRIAPYLPQAHRQNQIVIGVLARDVWVCRGRLPGDL